MARPLYLRALRDIVPAADPSRKIGKTVSSCRSTKVFLERKRPVTKRAFACGLRRPKRFDRKRTTAPERRKPERREPLGLRGITGGVVTCLDEYRETRVASNSSGIVACGGKCWGGAHTFPLGETPGAASVAHGLRFPTPSSSPSRRAIVRIDAATAAAARAERIDESLEVVDAVGNV